MTTRIDLVGKKEPDRVLRNMVLGIDGIAQVESGTQITYWTGDFSDEIGLKPVGREAWRLHDLGRVRLVQRKIASRATEFGQIPMYDYIATVA